MKLFTVQNPKTIKGEAEGYRTLILHLKPGGSKICPWATNGCRAACLNRSGRGQCGRVQTARARRTQMYLEDPGLFLQQLSDEIVAADKHAKREGMRLAVRVNGTSDLTDLAEKLEDHVACRLGPDCPSFYDYTKNPLVARGEGPRHIHYTFSATGLNDTDCARALARGINVAVVFDTKKGENLPKFFEIGGSLYDVIDGDASDLRFLDMPVRVVGLRAKGPARKDRTGFVVRVREDSRCS